VKFGRIKRQHGRVGVVAGKAGRRGDAPVGGMAGLASSAEEGVRG